MHESGLCRSEGSLLQARGCHYQFNRTCRSCAGDAALISKLLQCMFRDSRPAVVEGGVGMFQGARISESPQVEDPTLFEILDKLLELA